ncbi:MADS-box domain-containing protein [Aspergillus mulundensis]|uniref:MADS-box domain-containing protein n=1 Tax=Aspergillus mulundensis TaxID=1810919 RepID=A0A3D8RF18_9EURO|nr:hypothetical protein DSM5745_07815 [Aspergillus mulundensis]RDW72643.1 hypothetical protein DSM5745_07815 [Aspergillus mulundensis]
MADITAVGEENPSPTQDDLQQAAGNGATDNRGTKRNRMSADDDDDDEDKTGRERRKIEIKFIQDKSRRHITFSKRKAGIMKKVRSTSATEPSTLCFLHHPPYGLCLIDPIVNYLAVFCLDRSIRTLRPHGYSSTSSGRVRDRPRLHLHNPQAAATGYETRRKEPHPGLPQCPRSRYQRERCRGPRGPCRDT